jgi:hypothetical protein
MSGDRPSKTSKPKRKIRGSEPTLVAAGTDVPRKRRARGDEPTLVAPMTAVLYRPVDAAELARLQERGHRTFAPIEGAETIQLVCDEAHARALAGPGWVTRFAVRMDFLAKYPALGSKPREEYRVPTSELAVLNDSIVGPIVVLR